MNSLNKQFLPLIDGETRISVSLDGDSVEIRLSTWTDGLGWCDQKTLRFPDTMLDDIHRLISAARISRDREDPESTVGSKIINFPG
jgi:hypothetical protein